MLDRIELLLDFLLTNNVVPLIKLLLSCGVLTLSLVSFDSGYYLKLFLDLGVRLGRHLSIRLFEHIELFFDFLFFPLLRNIIQLLGIHKFIGLGTVALRFQCNGLTLEM